MQFASYEMKKYAAMMGIELDVKLSVDVSRFDTSKFFMFDSRYDDAFEICVKDGRGTITATNERALLIGVYHLLKCQGCKFLKPGKDGEYIPRRDTASDVSETWYANVRHRGTTNMCLCASENALNTIEDFIDWLPKVAANTLFIELEDYYDDYRFLMRERRGPCRTAYDLPRRDYDRLHAATIAALKKRHLLYHNAGHGWTIRLMEGIEKISFGVDTTPCKNPEILALTNGKRKVFNDKPMHTNLCYSQEKVRKQYAHAVLDYARRHPETDFIHVWLADYFGNFCECEECKKLRPSDWYMMILNEIDALLTENGIDTKIVFLIYFELAYPPVRETIHNPERFVMMFAPYGRDFTLSYRDSTPVPYEPKLNNDFDFKYMDMNLYLTQLAEWREQFRGDNFVFDYVFYDKVFFLDLCHVNYAKTPYLDCVDIKKYGLNGKIECGNTRAMTPTAFIQYAMFTELFYGNTDYDALYKEYFEYTYGKEQPVSRFLEEAAALLPYDFIHQKRNTFTETEKANMETLLELIRTFRYNFNGYIPDEHVFRNNCRYFDDFLALFDMYVHIIREKANGADKATIEELLAQYKTALYRAEALMPGYLSTNMLHMYQSQPFFDEN